MTEDKTKEELEAEASEKKAEDELASHAQIAEEGKPVQDPPSASSADIIRRDQADRFKSKQ